MSLYRSLFARGFESHTHTHTEFHSAFLPPHTSFRHALHNTHSHTQADVCSVLRAMWPNHSLRSSKALLCELHSHTHTQIYKQSLTPLVPTGLLPAAFSWLICCSIGQEEKQTSSEHTQKSASNTRSHAAVPDRSDFSDLLGHKRVKLLLSQQCHCCWCPKQLCG